MGGASSWNQPTLSSTTERINQPLVQKEPPKREARGLWALLERLKIGTSRQTNLKEDYILLGRRMGHNTIQ